MPFPDQCNVESSAHTPAHTPLNTLKSVQLHFLSIHSSTVPAGPAGSAPQPSDSYILHNQCCNTARLYAKYEQRYIYIYINCAYIHTFITQTSV